MAVYMIKENLDTVEKNIQAACDKAGRDRNEVTLIAVSKTKPVEMMEESMACNVDVFGENKVQEIDRKYPLMSRPVHWHMIGHLQRNKVKYLVGKVERIHSVDSLRLAQQIDQEYAKANQTANILLEVNVAKEDSKYGFLVDEVETAIRTIATYKNVCIKGLMTIAPYVTNPEDNRHYINYLLT